MNQRYAALPAVLAMLEAVNAGCLLVIWKRGERQAAQSLLPFWLLGVVHCILLSKLQVANIPFCARHRGILNTGAVHCSRTHIVAASWHVSARNA